jgi:murein DD-endopeptidase MepM/ murein hydrolase activator NlpD
MKGNRSYTIVVLGHSAQILKRFHLTRGVFVSVIAATVTLSTVGVLCALFLPPLTAAWFGLCDRLDSLEVQNRALVEQRQRMEDWLTEVGDRLERFEAETLRLAALTDFVKSPPRPAGGPSDLALSSSLEGRPAGEAIAELGVRSEQIDLKLDTIEAQLLQQADLLSTLPLLRPAEGRIGDGYGWRRDPFTRKRDFHHGVDIIASYGSPVVAPAKGVVTRAGYMPGYGLTVYLSHSPNISTRFGHLSRVAVRPGQRVARGDVLGKVGRTGRAAGIHLHYEVLVNGRKIDPARLLSRNISLRDISPSS